MDLLDYYNMVPTDRIPLLEATRLAWAKSLANKDSYYTMFLMLLELADAAANLPRYIQCRFIPSKKGLNDQNAEDEEDEQAAAINGETQDTENPGIEMFNVGENREYNTRTEKYLRSVVVEKDWRSFTLFLAIPRAMLESIVLGTVAWDYDRARGPGTRDHYTDCSGFGIYVVGVSVSNRGGAWLTANEIKVLIATMSRYIRGYQAWEHGGQSWAPGDRELQEFVASVDNQFGIHKSKVPRFVNSPDGKLGMEDLIKSLQRRVDASLLLAPAGNTPMVQSPLYVGLATELKNRVSAHAANVGITGTLKRSNKAYALLMSLMHYQGGINPVSTCRCVLRVWEKEDLWFAETLVAALASSLICQDGFNRTECGDPVKSKHCRYQSEAEQYVKYISRYLKDNMQAASDDVDERVSTLHKSRKLMDDMDVVMGDMDGLYKLAQDEQQLLEAMKKQASDQWYQDDHKELEIEKELLSMFDGIELDV